MRLRRKKKLGLALGSGGAKGMALLGALRALEEEKIEFDVVAGTSIGSVVGALYAKGYTVGDMLRLKDSSGVRDPQNVIMFFLGGQGLTGIMRRITGGAYFDDLVKPFRAVATDLVTGEEIDIGADKILAINLGAESGTNEVIKRSLDSLYPGNGVKLGKRSEQCYKFSDFVLAPDLRNYTGADITRLDEMYDIGYEEARKKMDFIKAALGVD